MKNDKILRKITQGMYVLTTEGGGCIVDSVSQISGGEHPLISVSVMKKNYTNKLLKQNKKFALSILGIDVKKEMIETFGFHSSLEMDKFQNMNTEVVEKVPVIKDSLGYMICEIIDLIENDTHTLFIGKLIDADMYREGEAMSYGYYQEHKEEILNVTSKERKRVFVCSVCGYVHEADFLPDDFQCPICGVSKSLFIKK